MSVEAPGKPPAETEISEGLIKNLIASQFPKLANLPVNIIGEGWDNVMARIDDELAARMPRHTVGEKLLKREQRWLPELAPRLPLPVPEPIHIGTPEHGYPFTWNVVRWIEGECATDLSGIWNLFEEPEARKTAIDAYGMSDATLKRAKGWAVFCGVILLETGLQDNPRHAAMGEATLRRLNEDA